MTVMTANRIGLSEAESLSIDLELLLLKIWPVGTRWNYDEDRIRISGQKRD